MEIMRLLLFGAALFAPLLSSAQSLSFVGGGRIPFCEAMNAFDGRIVEPRIDIIRTKTDWELYFGTQLGLPAQVQPWRTVDFCREQVIAVNLGRENTAFRRPRITRIRSVDEWTWEVTVRIQGYDGIDSSVPSIFSPYLAVVTPRGPDNFRFVFESPEGVEFVELRSAPRFYVVPASWWRTPPPCGKPGREDH
jgi:hypothetical protein